MSAQTSPRATTAAIPSPATPADDFKLTALIRELAETEPDPHKIAERLIAALTPEQMRAALTVALPDYIRKVRPYRQHGLRGGAGPIRSRRWSGVAEIRGELAILRMSVRARGAWKFLGDCDRDDCVDLASTRDQQAADVKAEAERYREIVKALRKHKAKTVRELPAEVVEGIFHA